MPASQARSTPAANRWASDMGVLPGTAMGRSIGAPRYSRWRPRGRYHARMPESPPEHPHPRAHALLLVVLAACLLLGLWGAWTVSTAGGGSDDAALRAELEGLRQEVATLSRSDQVSRDANQDLQGTLAERDEE